MSCLFLWTKVVTSFIARCKCRTKSTNSKEWCPPAKTASFTERPKKKNRTKTTDLCWQFWISLRFKIAKYCHCRRLRRLHLTVPESTCQIDPKVEKNI